MWGQKPDMLKKQWPYCFEGPHEETNRAPDGARRTNRNTRGGNKDAPRKHQ